MNKYKILDRVAYSPHIYRDLNKRFKNDREIAQKAVLRGSYIFKDIPDKFKEDKDFVIELIKGGTTYSFLENLPDDLKNNKEVFTYAMKGTCLAYEYMGKQLKSDKKYIISLINEGVNLLDTVYSKFRKDKDVVLASVRKFPRSIEYASLELQRDIDIIIASYIGDEDNFKKIPEKFRKDRNFILSNVKHNGLILEKCDSIFKKDYEICIAALTENNKSVYYIDNILFENKDFVIACIDLLTSEYYLNNFDFLWNKSKKYGRKILLDISDDTELMMKLIKIKPSVFVYASERLKNDESYVLDVLKVSPFCMEYAGNKLKNDKEFAKLALKISPFILPYLSSQLNDDIEIVMLAINPKEKSFNARNLLGSISERLRNSKEVILAVLEMDKIYNEKYYHTFENTAPYVWENWVGIDLGWGIKSDLDPNKMGMSSAYLSPVYYASDNLKRDIEVVKLAVKSSGLALQFIPGFYDNEEIISYAVSSNGLALMYASKRLRRNKSIVKLALENDFAAIAFADKSLLDDQAFVNEIISIPEIIFDIKAYESISRYNDIYYQIHLREITQRFSDYIRKISYDSYARF